MMMMPFKMWTRWMPEITEALLAELEEEKSRDSGRRVT